MGSEASKAKGPAHEADIENAMKKCTGALLKLKTSVSVLETKRNAAKRAAVAAFKRKDKSLAVQELRSADLAESEIQVLRGQLAAVEQQRALIEQQQRNTMLTRVLVDTSAALRNASTASGSDYKSVEAVQTACDQMEEVADMQAEVTTSHLDFGDVSRRIGAPVTATLADDDFEGDLERLEALAQDEEVQLSRRPPPVTPSPELPAFPPVPTSAQPVPAEAPSEPSEAPDKIII